jgi:glycosyltransferase involved in cell wall biosynthesis
MTQVAEEFVKNGYSVDVITAFPYYQQKVDRSRYSGKFFVSEQYKFSDDYEPINIIRAYTYSAGKKTFIRRTWTFLSFAISSVLASMKLKRNCYAVAITVSPPFFSFFSIYLAAKILRCPYILDIQDIYPETLEVLGIVKNKIVLKFLEFWELFFYKRAKSIIVISSGFKKTLSDRKVDSDKIVVIENWADPDVFVYSKEINHSLRQEYNFNGKFIVLFVGTIGICQGLEKTIRVLELVKDYPEIHFVFLGDGVSRKDLIEYTEQKNLSNATFILRQPHNLIPKFMCMGDVYFSHIRNNRLYSVTIPCKMYEYLAMGRPILTAVTGEAKNLVEELKSGVGVEPENPESLAEAVIRVYKDKRFYDSMLNNGREYIIRHANRGNMTAKYIRLIETFS